MTKACKNFYFSLLNLKKCCCILFCLLFYPFFLFNQSSLAVDQINKSLLKNANAVVRHANLVTEIHSVSNVHKKVDRTITVLNSKAKGFLDFNAGYKDGTSQLKNIEIKYFDNGGNLIREIKNKEIEDIASFDGYSIITDYRRKHFDFETSEYPITVKYSYELKTKNTDIPLWNPIPGYRVSVEKSEYSINNISGLNLRSKGTNLNLEGITAKSEFHYQALNLNAIVKERYAPQDSIFPSLEINSDQFVYQGNKGKANNWNELGKWNYDVLLEGEKFINEKIFKDIRGAINASSEKDLVKKIYKYIQENTRYVSVSLDEGGFKPMSYEKVHELKYGDCKALTFYTQALLSQFDINSDYVVVEAGSDTKDSFYSDYFSLRQGNHIILRVPLSEDTIWLDCTSNDAPFNFLGDFTDDRRVLLVNEDGGELSYTPKYGLDYNCTSTKAFSEINITGDVEFAIERKQIGIEYLDMKHIVKNEDKKIESYFTDNVYSNLKSSKIIKKDILFDEDNIEVLSKLNVQAKSFYEKVGDYIMFPVNVDHLDIPKLKKDKKRDYPIQFQRSYKRESNFVYKLPTGYSLFEDAYDYNNENEYGSYQIKIKEKENMILISRSFILNEGVYPKEEYVELKSFFDKARKKELTQITLKKTL